MQSPNMSASGHSVPTRGANGFPLPHTLQDRVEVFGYGADRLRLVNNEAT